MSEIGAFSISDVSPGVVQRLTNRLHEEKKLSLCSVKAVRDILNQAFIHAMELKLIGINPVAGTKAPRASREKAERSEDAKVIPKDDRTNILLAAEDDIRIKIALTVLMFTGMRVGEFLALPWKNVGFANGTITINQAITYKCEYDEARKLKSRSTVIGDTKTQGSNRSFRTAPFVIEALRQWREALPFHVKKSVNRDLLAQDAVVFPNDLGQMRTYDGFRTTYRRLMAEHILGDYILHSYRHTFATMLLEDGTNPKVVQKLLGHRDIETTLGIYSHVLPEVFDGVADTMDGLYSTMMKSASAVAP